MDVEALLREARKAQLQEYYMRWFPGDELIGSREKLVERLGAAMRDPQKVRGRFDRFGRSARDFVLALLSREGYHASLAEIRSDRRARSIEDFEVEGVVRVLLDEGIIGAVNRPGSDGGWHEVFQIPTEIGDALRRTVDIEERDVAGMICLRERFKGEAATGDKAAPATIEERLAGLGDAALADLIRTAIREFGGILTPSRHAQLRAEAPGGSPIRRPEVRKAIEDAQLGTTGVLSLRDFGIDLEEECLSVFQELVLESAKQEIRGKEPDVDREVGLGVDLLVDIERVLEIVHHEQIEVTREGTIFKKTEEKIGPLLVTGGYRECLEGDPFQQALGICRRLRFIEQEGTRLRCDPLRRRVWMSKRPMAKLREVYQLLEAENRSDHWSFHQGALREIFTRFLGEFPPGKWLPVRPYLTACLSAFLLSLWDRSVESEFRKRWSEDFHHEKLMVSLDNLLLDLSFWLVHRLALLGLVDLGYREGRLEAFRPSPLGVKFFGLNPGPGQGSGRLIVQPDFEVLLFPGGDLEAEWSLMLSRFADRLGSERVKRYAISSGSVRRGVVAGLDRGAILQFLESSAENPLPANVRYQIREWGEGVESITRHRVLLLRARTKSGADRLAALLEANHIASERTGETGILISLAKGERAVRDLEQALEDQGLYLE